MDVRGCLPAHRWNPADQGRHADDGGLFPILVLAVVWLVVAMLIWRYFNQKPADEDHSAQD
jgi:hypothetical protein